MKYKLFGVALVTISVFLHNHVTEPYNQVFLLSLVLGVACIFFGGDDLEGYSD